MAAKPRPTTVSFLCITALCLLYPLSDNGVEGKVRKYYIAAQEISWHYTDSQQNLVNPDQQQYADKYLKPGTDRIGSEYMKVTYFQYKDATFSTALPKPEYLGILGPTIRAEVGDTIDITYLNNASGTYSMHPHGVLYTKQFEGALYLDGTIGEYKSDEYVLQGQIVRLIWNVTDRDAPGPEDPPCLPWAYHSHVNTVKDTSAGLMGTLVTCRKNFLDDNNERVDVDLDIPILMKIYDENLSWLLERNINKFCQDPATCKKLSDEGDEDFLESNYMHSLNGRMFGHLKGLEACVNNKVAFYVIGMGNEFDVHSLYFQGQNLEYQHTRGDTVSVFTATFVAAMTEPKEAGTWIVSDMVDGMARDGMAAFYVTKDCNKNSQHDVTNDKLEDVKEYFLSAEEIIWDYGPGGKDLYTHKDLADKDGKSSYFFTKGKSRIGGVYKKARFFQYADSTFNVMVNRSLDDQHMGILGPVIIAEPGDKVKVTLKNDVTFPVSFLPHAMTFNYTEEIGNVAGSARDMRGVVSPGKQHTYMFHVPRNLLDGSDEPCRSFMYTSGVEEVKHHNTGLLGPILICKHSYNKSKSQEKRAILLLSQFDENESMFLEDNIKKYLDTSSISGLDKTDKDFQNSNKVYTINGLSFGTLRGLEVCLDETYVIHVMSLGNNEDVHSVAFDGNTFATRGMNRNVESLVAGSTQVLRMTPDNPGSWLVQSIARHALSHGGYALYTVSGCGRTPKPDHHTRVRSYYVAAEEVEWDYAPMERSLITGKSLDDPNVEGNVFVQNNADFIGDVYRKAVFREYEDVTFFRQKVRGVEEKHLDILGPVIRAEVNEKITILFRNKASRSYSMHPHGLKYSHVNSGRSYGNMKAGVHPGHTRFYEWYVPARSGPGPNDPDCIPWMYYSAIDQEKDTLAGLIGNILVCRPGTLDSQGRRKDRRPEFFVLMTIFNENKSWYLMDNIRRHAPNRIGTNFKEDEDFDESNTIHSINGRIFGNNPDLVMEYNKTVTWYFMVMGSLLDLHTIHTHGHTFFHSAGRHRDDVINLFPGMAEAVEMQTDNPGTWLLHCHTLDHIAAGMETTYTVLKPGEKIPKEGSLANTLIG